MSVSIVLEGPEGVGKTTQSTLLASFLEQFVKSPVLRIREPGGTPIGEAIRNLLFTEEFSDMSPNTHLLLFTAARNELITKKVRPWRSENPNGISVADRSWWSSIALQQVDGADISYIHNMQNPFKWYPTLTFYLDLPAEESMIRVETAKRLGGKRNWRDDVGIEIYCAIRTNYLSLAESQKNRVCVIDAFKNPWDILYEVSGQILNIMTEDKGCREAGIDRLKEFSLDSITDFARLLNEKGLYSFNENQQLVEEVRRSLGFPSKELLRESMYKDWNDWGFTELQGGRGERI
ncbi:dTMP kinase [Candidatus Woesebacteria bacterium RIFCSPHIGHO2_01_FULL_39_32]|uniref:Thymidylate kinase n=2 Tax=Candidatus Woeseibacteriota TaxID=1752722 RepID=A0A0G0S6S4_9BACT|nr:MAG: Thymidylate kinase [Candidatus Woesebacteria bacterium GW2011_GWA1_39_8]OGM04618.1 MAG: dTMP kinase [Candidatus Woesebacteria bacterium GWB1_37_5]OGM23968.1 MAG: dTMP kinase [Candidatus Woesebacteria bacterium RIFCSPHIGHO2_01_FULL_39_32]OGM37474.1 MAG: dTMP kinase [Candidatus Woesebacteria bacterium RIFCSPHIGHO2_12_FULL_38_11]OGM64157.1 MAG: dTMP kinase [Candidatus Woesebacteria bacterium RIFCSPLOWO2_01_FULL_39_25]